ncbi:hypothetical protein D3C75_885110 [compost metagenome]
MEDENNNDYETSRLIQPGYNRLNHPHEGNTSNKGEGIEQRCTLYLKSQSVKDNHCCHQRLQHAHHREGQRAAHKPVEPARADDFGTAHRNNECADQCTYEQSEGQEIRGKSGTIVRYGTDFNLFNLNRLREHGHQRIRFVHSAGLRSGISKLRGQLA